MFVFLLEKQNAKTSMYILECRSTEPNRTAGLGRASPHPHAHSHRHAHTDSHTNKIETPQSTDPHPR